MKLIKRTVALLFALVVAGTAAIPSLADEPLLRNGGLEEIKEGDWDPDAGKNPCIGTSGPVTLRKAQSTVPYPPLSSMAANSPCAWSCPIKTNRRCTSTPS